MQYDVFGFFVLISFTCLYNFVTFSDLCVFMLPLLYTKFSILHLHKYVRYMLLICLCSCYCLLYLEQGRPNNSE